MNVNNASNEKPFVPEFSGDCTKNRRIRIADYLPVHFINNMVIVQISKPDISPFEERKVPSAFLNERPSWAATASEINTPLLTYP